MTTFSFEIVVSFMACCLVTRMFTYFSIRMAALLLGDMYFDEIESTSLFSYSFTFS